MAHSRPEHPGSALSAALDARGISISRAAQDLGVSRQILSAILNERRPITPEMAVRIGHYIGNEPAVWASMQTHYDIWNAERKMKSVLKKIPKAAAIASSVAAAPPLNR